MAATTAKIGPQDLPPKGGYAPIQTERTKLRTLMGAKSTIGLVIASTVIGTYIYFWNYRLLRRSEVETRSARMALFPMLLAERDRAFLKQLRINRDEEADLMKNYPGWVVGTYFGQPVFKTLPEGTFVEPDYHEFNIHADFLDMIPRYMMHLIT